jgi:hypothetical protein
MRNTLYAAVAASLAMLATSGIVALATAAPPAAPQRAEDAQVEAWVSAMIDQQYREVVARNER